MAIAFNLPSEREATEESYSRLNRLLAELYDVLCHILVSRQPQAATAPPPVPAPRDPSPPHRGECPDTDANNAPPYHLRCNSTYIVNLVMVVAIIKVSLASSMFNTIR